MASLSSKLGVCNLATPLISGTGKATDFKFGVYIYMANRNKSPLKISEKMERGRIQRLPNFWGVPRTISGTSKATDFIFGGYIYRDNLNKKAVLSQRWPRNAPMRPIHGCPEILGTPWLLPSLQFPTFFMGFCCDRSYKCSYKIWSPKLYPFLR